MSNELCSVHGHDGGGYHVELRDPPKKDKNGKMGDSWNTPRASHVAMDSKAAAALVHAHLEKHSNLEVKDKKKQDLDKVIRAGYRELVNGKPDSMDAGDDVSETGHEPKNKGSGDAD